MSRINGNAINFEYILNLFDHDTSGRLNSIRIRHGVNVIRVEFIEIQNFVVREHRLWCVRNYENEFFFRLISYFLPQY